jgi:HK97 family phage portal protein
VIAGVFGVPPQFVGDLERATFNNAEQQSLDFVQHVILPYVREFEAAMERDLLTDEDRAGGVILRFNLDAALRGDYLTRQQGLKIQREAGVVNPNEWREQEGMNPRPDEGGEAYWDQGPSGQGRSAEPAVPALNGRNGGS